MRQPHCLFIRIGKILVGFKIFIVHISEFGRGTFKELFEIKYKMSGVIKSAFIGNFLNCL